MRFWDSSAVVAVIMEEPSSGTLRGLLKEDRAVLVWWATRTECISALTRRMSYGKVSDDIQKQYMDKIGRFIREADEVDPQESVRHRADSLLKRHRLTAADAFQLSAALSWTGDDPSGKEFVCLDAKLRDAARKEGFEVRPK